MEKKGEGGGQRQPWRKERTRQREDRRGERLGKRQRANLERRESPTPPLASMPAIRRTKKPKKQKRQLFPSPLRSQGEVARRVCLSQGWAHTGFPMSQGQGGGGERRSI